ncbi:MAG: YihY/virulence factor BrkB family protein [Pirellulales bacterium]
MSLLRKIGWRLWAAYQGFQEHEGTLSAAAIAYYVALSFFPLLLVLMAGLGWLLEWTDFGQAAQQELLAAIEQQISPDLANQIGRMLKMVSERASTGGPIGFVVLVISAIAIFAQLDAALDRIFKMPMDPHESWQHWFGQLLFKRVKALGMLLGVGAFIFLVMISSMILSAALRIVEPGDRLGPWVEWVSSASINLVLNLLAFAIIYRVLPKPYIRWSEALRGGIFTAILWEAGRQALAAYLLRLNYPTAYGVIGSFLAVMLWAYYGALVILIGAEYVRVLREERMATPRSGPAAQASV